MPVDKLILIEHRLKRAKETMTEALDDIEKGFLYSAENRIYYAIFYSVLALAMKYDFASSKHKQLLGWFNKEFIKTGKVEKELGDTYKNSLENRLEGDYEDFKNFVIDEVEEDYKNMERFINRVEQLIKS